MRHIEIREDRWLVLHDYRPRYVEAKTLSITRRYWRHSRLYAEDGSLWRPEPVDGHELALITRILAHTIYNPRLTLSMSFERIGEYSLSNLRTIVQKAFGSMLRSRPYVDDDHDFFVATQTTEDRLGLAANFDEIFRLLRAYPHWAAAW